MNAAPPRADRALDACVWLCACALVMPLAIPLVTGRVFIADDLSAYHLPVRHLYREALRHGDSILWTPSFFTGFYLHGEGQGGFAHPWHWLLYRWLPLDTAFNLELLGNYLFGFAGMWMLLRRAAFDSAASAFGAMLFAFSGFALLHISHLNMVSVAMQAPWIVLAATVLLTDRTPRVRAFAFLGLAAAIGSAILLGFPQFVWMDALIAAAFVFVLGRASARRTDLVLVGAAIVLGVLIGFAQLLPTLDLSQASRRPQTANFATSLSLDPRNLVQLVSPYFFATRVYAKPEELLVHEFGVYDGAFVTVSLAWLLARGRRLARADLAIAAGVFAAIGLVLALGRFGGVYPWLARAPGLSQFRAPARHLFLVHFAFAVIGAAVFQDLARIAAARGERLRRVWPIAVPLAMSAVLLGVAAFPAVTRWASGHGMAIADPAQVVMGTLIVAATTIAMALAVRGHAWILVPLAMLAAFDLGWSGERYVWRVDPIRPYSILPTVGIPPRSEPGDYVAAPVPPVDTNVLVLHGYRLSNSYSALPPGRMTIEPDQVVAERLSGVRWTWMNPGWAALEGSLPRARLVSDVQVREDPASALHAIDIARTAIVPAPIAHVEGAPGVARMVVDRPGRIEIDATASAPQLLVMSERFHAGWRALQDGRAIETVRVYGDRLGALVAAGSHRIDFTFDPASARIGLRVSIAAACATMLVSSLLFFASARKTPHAPQPPGPRAPNPETPRAPQPPEPRAPNPEARHATPPGAGAAISVVVLNYNGVKWLDQCLRSLDGQRGVDGFEVVLVDNASTDGSADFVRRAFPSVRLLALGENVGFAAGNNAGARMATGSLLAFLNNDTRVDPGWLSALSSAFADPLAGLATSRIVFMNEPDVIDSAGDGYLLAGGAYKRHFGGSAADAMEPREVFGACGAAFMIRRALFDEIGGFDQAFFIYYEDVDLSYRARLRGARCVYVPGAIVQHAGSAAMGAQSARTVFFGQRNLEWVYLKNTPAGLLVRTLASHLVYDAAAAVYFARRGRFGAFVRGKLAALGGLPRILRERRRIQASRRASIPDLRSVMDGRWIQVKQREKRALSARSASPPRT